MGVLIVDKIRLGVVLLPHGGLLAINTASLRLSAEPVKPLDLVSRDVAEHERSEWHRAGAYDEPGRDR